LLNLKLLSAAPLLKTSAKNMKLILSCLTLAFLSSCSSHPSSEQMVLIGNTMDGGRPIVKGGEIITIPVGFEVDPDTAIHPAKLPKSKTGYTVYADRQSYLIIRNRHLSSRSRTAARILEHAAIAIDGRTGTISDRRTRRGHQATATED